MVTTTVAPPLFSISDLAERALVANARVGSCIEARRYGRVVLIVDAANILISYDDGESKWQPWTAISALGGAR